MSWSITHKSMLRRWYKLLETLEEWTEALDEGYGIYITLQTLVVWSAVDRTLHWIQPRWESITSTSIVETCQKYWHYIYTVKIVNKRPRSLLNEIQNVFINKKQVKTAKTAQIIPWFPRFYGTKTTGNSQRRYSPHAWTVTFARWQRLPTEVWGCGQLAGGLKVGRRDISKFKNSLEWLYSRCSYNTLQTMLKPTHKVWENVNSLTFTTVHTS